MYPDKLREDRGKKKEWQDLYEVLVLHAAKYFIYFCFNLFHLFHHISVLPIRKLGFKIWILHLETNLNLKSDFQKFEFGNLNLKIWIWIFKFEAEFKNLNLNLKIGISEFEFIIRKRKIVIENFAIDNLDSRKLWLKNWFQ